ncbi:protein stoned-A [Anabrus simplex]|uniref:protein stoned-A n=1 Tax=Anabrus simplex TaxID=316456 RepID=UPI0035A366F9
MHKITKGLKKKKKNKKSKKGEDDLFDPAELEKYRREHQQQQDGQEGTSEDAAAESAGGADGDEWRQFKALTAGVDSVLKKTQGDLDRIKSTSYFQRKSPQPEVEQQEKDQQQPSKAPQEKKKGKRWVGFEEGAGVHSAEETEDESESAEQQPATEHTAAELLGAEAEEEEVEEEEEEEADEDIFDTSYVDVVTSGEVKLAYIPDSPTEQDPTDFDPFDTSIAEKLIKDAEEAEAKKKKLVSLGCAVEVLTGKLDKVDKLPSVSTPSGKKRRPRKGQDVDLLLGSFDDNGNTNEPSELPANEEFIVEVTTKSLLDEDNILLDPLDVPPVKVNLIEDAGLTEVDKPASSEKEEKPQENVLDLKNLVQEFDIITVAEDEVAPKSVTPIPAAVVLPEDELEDEFAALAAESLSKVPGDKHDLGEECADPFDTSAADALLGGPADSVTARDPFDAEVSELTSNFSASPRRVSRTFPISPDVDIVLASDSPALTSWTAFETEEDSSLPPVIKPTKPPPPRPQPPGASQAGQFSTPLEQAFTDTDILALAEDLNITPLAASGEADPFDTTFAENILPGKVELKLIENEILGGKGFEVNEAHILSRSDSDFDFNPREDERIHHQQFLSTVSIHITDPAGEVQPEEHDPFNNVGINSLTLSHRDLLGGSTTDLSKLAHDPIEPAPEPQSEEISYTDPFDTSIVDVITAPGKAELKFIEKELLGEVVSALPRDLSDPDFDPRAEELAAERSAGETPVRPPQIARPDILVVSESSSTVPKVVAFDLPTPSSRPDLLVVGQEEGSRISKPLTPYYVDKDPTQAFVGQDEGNSDVEVDPFDTSFAENLAPGKAELKIIESEFVGESSGLKHSLSDQDFNPRGEEENAGKNINPPEVQCTVNLGRRFSDFTGDRRRLPPRTLPLSSTVLNPLPTIPAVPTPTSKPDLLVVEENIADIAKPLTPAVERKPSIAEGADFDYTDPFDTSIASNLLPGKAELKLLESELISEPGPESSIRRSYTDPDFNPRDSPDQEVAAASLEKPDLLNIPSEAGPIAKPLTPAIPDCTNGTLEGDTDYTDPFDTSLVGDLVPGKAELRVLESELIGQ